jgi:hypothetical protein
LRIIYSFHKKGRFWFVACPSDKSTKESIYNSQIEAINNFFVTHEDMEYFEIVIPLSIPNPISISKRIYKTIPVIQDKIIKPITPIKVVYQNEWDNKPIPESTIEFKYGMKWLIIIPPYQKENIHYLNNPLPGTSKIASGRGSASKTIQIFNGTLDHDIFIDLGWSNAHIFSERQELKIAFSGGQKGANQRWQKKKQNEKLEHQSVFNWVKRIFRLG